MPLVSVQSFMFSILDGLEMPYGKPAAKAFITPPDPRVQARIPAIYIWPSDGDSNRSGELGGTVPRNTGPNTSSGTRGMMHRIDVYITWFSANSGKRQDPIFPGMVDALMYALMVCTPNPVEYVDPNSRLASTIYNIGETMTYKTGVESTQDERFKKYDALITCNVWEIFNL